MIQKIEYQGRKKNAQGEDAIVSVISLGVESYKKTKNPTICEFKGMYVTVGLKRSDEERVKLSNFERVIMISLNSKSVIDTVKVYRIGARVSPVTIDFTKFKERKRQSHIHAKAGPFSQTFLVNRDFDIDPEIGPTCKPLIIYKVTQQKRQIRFIRTVALLPTESTEIMYMLNLMSEIKVVGKH